MSEIYIVTGAAGHLGGTIVRKLLARGETVRALALPGETPPGEPEVVRGNVLDRQSMEPLFAVKNGAELTVIHCAGIVSIASKYDKRVYDVNVTGTKNVVDMCVEHGVKKLVYVSSVHAIPEKPGGECMSEVRDFKPERVVGLYAKTKAEATDYALAAAGRGLDVSVVHPSGIYGPYDDGRNHLTTLILDFCRRRLTAAVKGGYDFVDVRDVADGVISCCERGRPGECYILSNRYLPVSELLNSLSEITGVRKIRTYLPLWFAKMTAPLAELYYKMRRQPPLFTSYSLYTLSGNASFSHAKATAELGYAPRDIRRSLADTVLWLKERRKL